MQPLEPFCHPAVWVQKHPFHVWELKQRFMIVDTCPIKWILSYHGCSIEHLFAADLFPILHRGQHYGWPDLRFEYKMPTCTLGFIHNCCFAFYQYARRLPVSGHTHQNVPISLNPKTRILFFVGVHSPCLPNTDAESSNRDIGIPLGFVAGGRCSVGKCRQSIFCSFISGYGTHSS